MTKRLFEILTGAIGESYVRCYVWAEDFRHAERLFRERHPTQNLHKARILMTADAPAFCTDIEDAGWPEDEPPHHGPISPMADEVAKVIAGLPGLTDDKGNPVSP